MWLEGDNKPKRYVLAIFAGGLIQGQWALLQLRKKR
jgi:hypothetical protein